MIVTTTEPFKREVALTVRKNCLTGALEFEIESASGELPINQIITVQYRDLIAALGNEPVIPNQSVSARSMSQEEPYGYHAGIGDGTVEVY